MSSKVAIRYFKPIWDSGAGGRAGVGCTGRGSIPVPRGPEVEPKIIFKFCTRVPAFFAQFGWIKKYEYSLFALSSVGFIRHDNAGLIFKFYHFQKKINVDEFFRGS